MSAPYRWLIRLFPERARRAWGEDFAHTADDALRAARARGRWAVLATHAWLLFDTLRALLSERFGGSPRRHPPAARASLRSVGSTGGRGRFARAADALAQDVRYGVGQWKRTPGFAAFAVTTLALGMGAMVAIFTVVNGALLRPLPYEDADRIALTWFFPWADLEEMRGAPAVEAVVPWQGWRAEFREGDGTVGVRHSASVDPSYFDVLGVRPTLGRLFTASDDPDRQADELVLSWGFWQADFSGSPDVLGTTLVMEDRTYTIVGVAPRYFSDPLGWPINQIETSMFRLLRAPPPELRQDRSGRAVVGSFVRLREGVTPEQARVQIEERLRPHYVDGATPPAVAVVPARDARTSEARQTLLILLGSAVVLLLVGCGNAANLLLSRATARQREFTVRGALGAGRRRLAGQILVESVLLALVAGALGTWLGYAGARAIVRLGGEFVPRGEEVLLDHRVLLFAFAASLSTALVFGLFPALQGSRASLATGAGGRGGSATAGARRLRSVLVVAEIGLAVALTFGAGLLTRSLWNLERVDPGYQEEVLTLRVTMTPRRYDPERRVRMHDEIVERIRALPGVTAAAAITYHPLSGGSFFVPVARPEAPPPADNPPRAMLRSVTGGYFETMGIRVRAGRTLTAADRAAADAVVVINASLGSSLFPGEDPIGRRLSLAGSEYRIVGVVDDVKEFTLDGQGTAVAYITYGQTPVQAFVPSSTVVVRGRGAGHALTASVRAAIRRVDDTVPVAFIRTMRDMMDITLLAPRLQTTLLGTFGVLAALLSALGLTGVIAYGVSQRVPEIAVRMAVGAQRSDVTRSVVSEALRLASVGIVVGVVGALWGGRLLASLIYGIPAHDPGTLTAVIVGTLLLAVGASLYPAARAVRVSPSRVLRGL